MAVSTSVAIASAAAPATRKRISTRRLLAINALWFGQGAHWPPINFVLLPLIGTLIARGSADLFVGRVSAAGNLFALLAPVLAGWLSDRTSTRWGRRRPWILAGTAVNLAGLGFLAVSGAPLTFAFAYMLVQLSFNLAGGAYAAVSGSAGRAAFGRRKSKAEVRSPQTARRQGVMLVSISPEWCGAKRCSRKRISEV